MAKKGAAKKKADKKKSAKKADKKAEKKKAELSKKQKEALKDLDQKAKPPAVHWWKFVLLIALFIAAGWFLRHAVTNPPADIPFELGEEEPVVQEPVYQTVSEEVFVDVSIENVSGNLQAFVREDVSLTGYLGHRFEGDSGIDYGPSGVNIYYVIDDYDNVVELSGVLGDLKAPFEQDAVTEELYLIRGKVQSSLGRTELVVSSIKRVERPTKIVERRVLVS